jgi:hypothetical protein
MRRRLLAAIMIIASSLFVLAWVDDQLLLRNPIELDTRARLILHRLFPDQEPHIDHIEVDFSGRRVIAQGLELREKGTKLDLLKVARVEATLSLTEWLAPREVNVRGVTGHLRLRGDHLNVEDLFAGGGGEQQPSQARSSPISLSVQDVRVDFTDENIGAHSLLICDHAELTVQPDGRVTGTGHARAGALVAADSPFAAGGAGMGGTSGLVYREIVEKLDFDLDRRADGRTSVPVYVEHVVIGPLLRSLLPRYVQDVIWSELNPEGVVDANITVTLGVKTEPGSGGKARSDPHLSITLNAKNATLKPKKFPYPIHDINGRFEVSVAALPIVSWEDVTARLDGAGRVAKARGSFFLGDDTEKVSLYIFIDARDVPLDAALRDAMPDDIRSVYDQFGCQGTAGPAKVVIFKGPFMDEPQLSIRTSVDGRQSAAFADYPVRLTAEKGTFTLREGGNVEVDADGTLEGGGATHVEAHVVHGDLIHVHVTGEHVRVTPALMSRLDEPVRRMVEPFRPQGGEIGFDVVVEKSDPALAPRPHATVALHGVTVAPEVFPYRLRTDGVVHVTPRTREGAPPTARPEIKVDLALEASGNALAAAVISGSVTLDPERKDADFEGALTASCERIDADKELIRALPREIQKVVERLAPQGSIKNLKAKVRSIESFDADAEGDGMTVALDAFPYRVGLDRVVFEREDRLLTLHHVEGSTDGGGRYSVEGTVEMPRPNSASDPLVSVAVEARGAAIDPALLAALPGDARRSLERLSPTGGTLDASLRVALAPALPLDLTGTVVLAGSRISLDKLDPSLAGLGGSPVEDLSGTLRLDGERVWIDALEGRFRGVPVSAGGSIAMSADPGGATRPSWVSHSDGAAPIASPVKTIDLVAHVDALQLDEATRSLARGPVEAALLRFPVEGACDLDFRLVRLGDQDPSLDVRVRPRGVKVVPKILPFDFEDVTGTIDVRHGEPETIELTARLGKATVAIRRDKRQEGFVEPGTSVFVVKAEGVHPEELAAAPEDFAKMVKDFEIKGAVDLDCSVAIPSEERAKQTFVAELRTSGFSVVSGLRFEDCRGTLRVAGSVAKFEPLELAGTLSLDHAVWKCQELNAARIPVKLQDGQLYIGSVREPFAGDLYGGQLRGRIHTNLKDERAGDLPGHGYQGSIFLQAGQLRVAADELARLGATANGNGPKSGGTGDPVRGELTVKLDFQGGGTSPDGRPIGLSGDSVILATDANFIRVPLMFGTLVDVVKGVTKGDSSYDPKAFDRLYAKLRLKPSHIDVDLIRLDSDTLSLAGKDGRLDWDGAINLDLLPFKTGGIFDDIFKQFVGVSVRGTVGKPETHEIPFYNGLDRIWNGIRSAFATAGPERVGDTTAPK